MSAKVQVDQYFAALKRLVARGALLSNDAVSQEAGKGRGSIKKGRPAHANLIKAIEEATKKQNEAKATADPVAGLKEDVQDLTAQLDQSLEREVALLNELYDLRARVKQLTEDNRQLKMGRLVPVQ